MLIYSILIVIYNNLRVSQSTVIVIYNILIVIYSILIVQCPIMGAYPAPAIYIFHCLVMYLVRNHTFLALVRN